MYWLRRRLTYANVISSLALFLVLSGGTAVALSGSNTVFSDDITDGNVRNADIGSGAVTNSKLGFRSVTLEKINGNAINSGRVVDNSLTGNDLLESTLGQVPSAGNANTLDNKDSSEFAAGPVCDVDLSSGTTTSSTFGDLSGTDPGPSVTVDVPSVQLVAIYAEAEMSTTSGTAQVALTTGAGDQRIFDTTSASPVGRATLAGDGAGTFRNAGGWVVLSEGQVSAGSQTFSLKYRVTGGTTPTATFLKRKLCVMPIG
jgi:hypothetical protein